MQAIMNEEKKEFLICINCQEVKDGCECDKPDFMDYSGWKKADFQRMYNIVDLHEVGK